jgi:PAS domain S-box-containing protein
MQIENASLRARAEQQLHGDSVAAASRAQQLDARALAYELQVHKIELELQSETLREANRTIERQRENYLRLYEGAPVPYVTLDAETRIVDANAMALLLLGRSRNAVVGVVMSRFIAPEHTRAFHLHCRAVREQSNVAHVWLDVLAANGRKPVRLESARAEHDTGHCLIALIDQTESRELERVRREHAFVSSVLDTAAFLVLLDGRGRIVRVNGASIRALCSAEAVGRPFWDVMATPAQRELTQARIEAQLESGASAEWEGNCIALDGGERAIGWSLTMLNDEHGAFKNVIMLGTDLSERKRVEARLLVADRFSVIGMLAAGVGHEINNPLAYLICSLEIAARTASRLGGTSVADIECMREVLGTANEGAQRIRMVVDELRRFASDDERRLEAVDVRTALESCVQLVSADLHRHAKLITSYRDVPTVLGTPSRIRQVFLNLLINAMESIPEDEADDNEIRLSVRPASVDGERKVVVEVQDTGVGIEAEDLPRIFDPFFSTKPMGEGVGLGLTVCQNVVTQLGGEIAIESVMHVGTTFRVTLPAALE